MDYGKMIRDSFALAWKYKSLWIFGLFAGMGGGFNTSFGKHDLASLESDGSTVPIFGQWGTDAPQMLHYLQPFLIGLAIFGLVYLVMYCISQPALVDAVNRATRGGTYKFSESFSTGVDFFWRTLGLTILTAIVGIIAVGAVVGCVVVAWVISPVLGIITLLPAIPVAICLFIAFIMITNLSLRAMVVRNVSMGDAIEEGYTLLRNHLGKNVAFFFIMFLLAIGLGVIIGIVTLIVYAPIVLLAYSLGVPLWAAFLIAVILALPISIPLGGYMGTFFSSLFTMFYFGLVEPSGPQSGYVAPSETGPVIGV